jgi:hypothetical protein
MQETTAPTTRLVLAALSAGAGLIHLVMVPAHLAESTADGGGFLVAAAVQLALAVVLATSGGRRALGATVAANTVFIGAWVVSRTAGLPYGSHSGHPAAATFVDVVCVGLEVALLVGAAAVLLRPRLGDVQLARIGLLAPLAVLALAGAAIASPSARDHAAASHGEHGERVGHDDVAAGAAHEHTEAEADDGGLSLLTNGHPHETGEEPLDAATQAALTAQLARTIELVQAYPTAAHAAAAGYRRAGPFSPGLGIHYQPPGYHLNPDGVIDGDDILHPFLIFDGTEPDAPIAGFMYMNYGGQGEPEGFIGPNDHWHYHERVCLVVRPDGQFDTPFGADREGVTDQMCTDVGGSFIETTGYMVHVWTVPGYESSRGVFSEINPRIDCPDGTYHEIDVAELGAGLTTCRTAT